MNIEEQIEDCEVMLKKGQIDKVMYYKKVERLIKLAEMEYKMGETATIQSTFLLLASIFLVIYLVCNFIVVRNKEKTEVSRNLQRPTQITTSGETVLIVGDKEVDVDYIADYIIEGRVVETEDYVGYNIQNQISPTDIGMSWGIIARDENNKKIKWSATNSRWLNWRVDDEKWLDEIGGKDIINQNSSNTHLIPADEEIEKQIRLIEINDYVKLEGYLVNVNYGNETYSYSLNSSTSRTDTGYRSCEVMYVKSLTWIK